MVTGVTTLLDEDSPDPRPPTGGGASAGLGGAAAQLAATDLEAILLGPDDLPGSASSLDRIRVADPADPDHPILDYAYCDIAPPLLGVGASAGDVYRLGGLLDVALSTATVLESEPRAQDVAAQIVANAGTCDSYPAANGATVEVVEERADAVVDGL